MIKAVEHSSRFDVDIEYDPRDPSRMYVADDGKEVLVFWGITEKGECFFVSYIDGEFCDDLTEEA